MQYRAHRSRSKLWVPKQSQPETDPNLSIYRNRRLRHEEFKSSTGITPLHPRSKHRNDTNRQQGNEISAQKHQVIFDESGLVKPNPHHHRTIEGKIRKAFKVDSSYDVDGDGIVSPEDFAIARQVDRSKQGTLSEEQQRESRVLLAKQLLHSKAPQEYHGRGILYTPRRTHQAELMAQQSKREFAQLYQREKSDAILQRNKYSRKVLESTQTPFQCDDRHRGTFINQSSGATTRSQMIQSRKEFDNACTRAQCSDTTKGYNCGRRRLFRNTAFTQTAQQCLSGPEAVRKLEQIVSRSIFYS